MRVFSAISTPTPCNEDDRNQINRKKCDRILHLKGPDQGAVLPSLPIGMKSPKAWKAFGNLKAPCKHLNYVTLPEIKDFKALRGA